MKYIRTFEEPNKIHEVAWVSCGFIGFLDEKNGCDQSHIYKQADTIEELCDEFVYITSKNKKIIEPYFSRNNGIEIINVYGAIWTDKGLIYVAKMNDKGELELL